MRPILVAPRAALLGIAVLVAGCGGSGTTSGPAAPSPSTSNLPGPSAGTTPGRPSSVVAPAASNGRSTPPPGDTAAAVAAVGHYEAALESGRFRDAWALLAPQARPGTLAAFSSERAAYLKTMGGRYSIVARPKDVAPIDQWVPPADRAAIVLSSAVLVEVTYPAHADNNAAWELFIAQPTPGEVGPDASWQLYQVR